MKNYSVNTIDAYLPHKQFVSRFALQNPEELAYRQIPPHITETAGRTNKLINLFVPESCVVVIISNLQKHKNATVNRYKGGFS